MAEALGKDRIATRLTFLWSAHPNSESLPRVASALWIGRRFLKSSSPGRFSLNSFPSMAFSVRTFCWEQRMRAGGTFCTWLGQLLGRVTERVISEFCGNVLRAVASRGLLVPVSCGDVGILCGDWRSFHGAPHAHGLSEPVTPTFPTGVCPGT